MYHLMIWRCVGHLLSLFITYFSNRFDFSVTAHTAQHPQMNTMVMMMKTFQTIYECQTLIVIKSNTLHFHLPRCHG